MGESVCSVDNSGWFPFTATEIEVALGVFGFLTAVASFAGVPGRTLAAFGGGYAVIVYVSGLFVYARRAARTLRFTPDASLRGEGYLDSFRQAKRSLFLMHIDDDAPGEELQALYRSLLKRGVQIRRVIFLRESSNTGTYKWVRDFGDHPNLEQRVIPPEEARLMWFCFVLVDATEVIFALPGYEPVDAASFAHGFVLRHLVAIRDDRVAATFVRTYQAMWEHAGRLRSVEELADPAALLSRIRKTAGATTFARTRRVPEPSR